MIRVFYFLKRTCVSYAYFISRTPTDRTMAAVSCFQRTNNHASSAGQHELLIVTCWQTLTSTVVAHDGRNKNKTKTKNGTGGIRTSVTGVAARNAAD